MKILHINTHNTGGAAIACLRIHKALLTIGIDSKVLLRSKTETTVPEVYEIWEEFNYFQKAKKLIAQKRLEKKQRQLLYNNNELTELFTFPDSVWDITLNPHYKQADIIHLHWVAGFLDYPSFFTKCDKPIVWTIHDFAPFSGGFHYPQSNIDSSINQLNTINLQLKGAALQDATISVVSPSKYLMEQSKSDLLFGQFPHHQVLNCIPNSFSYIDPIEARKVLGIPIESKIVLFVADQLFYPRKGFHLLLKATQMLDEEGIDFYVVGEDKIDTDNDKIHYLGKIEDNKKLNQIYAASDIFVIPSLNDNLPNTISEALCSGTPVIGFNVGGITEMINSNNGTVCKEITSESLSQSIQDNMSKVWNKIKISIKAQKKYNPEICANSYLSIYKTLKLNK